MSVSDLGTMVIKAVEETRLEPGTMVAIGAGDICSAALGAEVVKPGQLCAIIGTAEIYEERIKAGKRGLVYTRSWMRRPHRVR